MANQPSAETSSGSGSGSESDNYCDARSLGDRINDHRLPVPGLRETGTVDRPGRDFTEPLTVSADVRRLVEAGRADKQCDPPVACYFCGGKHGQHLYLYAPSDDGRLVAGYLGVCDHMYFDGKPWCDHCYVLAFDGGGWARASCAECCGVSWGRPIEGDPRTKRLAIWSEDYILAMTP